MLPELLLALILKATLRSLGCVLQALENHWIFCAEEWRKTHASIILFL